MRKCGIRTARSNTNAALKPFGICIVKKKEKDKNDEYFLEKRKTRNPPNKPPSKSPAPEPAPAQTPAFKPNAWSTSNTAHFSPKPSKPQGNNENGTEEEGPEAAEEEEPRLGAAELRALLDPDSNSTKNTTFRVLAGFTKTRKKTKKPAKSWIPKVR